MIEDVVRTLDGRSERFVVWNWQRPGQNSLKPLLFTSRSACMKKQHPNSQPYLPNLPEKKFFGVSKKTESGWVFYHFRSHTPYLSNLASTLTAQTSPTKALGASNPIANPSPPTQASHGALDLRKRVDQRLPSFTCISCSDVANPFAPRPGATTTVERASDRIRASS